MSGWRSSRRAASLRGALKAPLLCPTWRAWKASASASCAPPTRTSAVPPGTCSRLCATCTAGSPLTVRHLTRHTALSSWLLGPADQSACGLLPSSHHTTVQARMAHVTQCTSWTSWRRRALTLRAAATGTSASGPISGASGGPSAPIDPPAKRLLACLCAPPTSLQLQ